MGAPAARVAELSRHWRAWDMMSPSSRISESSTGVVPEEWRSRLHRLHCHRHHRWRESLRTWLWPLPNRKAHERIRITRPSASRQRSALDLALPKPTWSSPLLRNCCAPLRDGGWLGGSASPLFLKSAISGRNRWRRRRGQRRQSAPSHVGCNRRISLSRAQRIVVVAPAFTNHLMRYWNVPPPRFYCREWRRDRCFPPRPGSGRSTKAVASRRSFPDFATSARWVMRMDWRR